MAKGKKKEAAQAPKINGKEAVAAMGVAQAKAKQPKPKPEAKVKAGPEAKEQARVEPRAGAGPQNGFAKRIGKKEPKAKKEKPQVDLEPLKKKVLEAQAELTKAQNDAKALEMQAKSTVSVAKETYAKVLAPYRDACRKAGVKCEFTGGKAGPVAPRVRFLVERVDGGIKVAIKGRSETEAVIPDKTLKESIGKAAFTYCDRVLGPESEYGKKWAGLSNRLRKIFASQ